MIAPFSPLEIQLVRASLSTKSTEEISILLERSSDEVTELINDITNGKAEDRERDVRKYILEQLMVKQSKKSKPDTTLVNISEKKRKERAVDESRKNKRLEAERAWETQRLGYRKREDQRKYKTRIVDQSKLITVKLDDKTWAQVEIQETKEKTEQLIKQTRALYDANKTLNKYKLSGL
jgi:hypothetical protein